jgi:hypothetical protein
MRYTDLEDGLVPDRAPSPGVVGLPLWTETDQAAAEKAREEAIQRAHEHADRKWRETAYAAILTVARRLSKFTADDVWAELKGSSPKTHNASALGPLFRIAAGKGICRKTGEQRPTVQVQRHRDLTVWESCILDARGAA